MLLINYKLFIKKTLRNYVMFRTKRNFLIVYEENRNYKLAFGFWQLGFRLIGK